MSTENKTIRPEKAAMYREVRDQIAGADYLLMMDGRGLTAAETRDVKQRLHDVDARFRVVKNRMLVRICREAGVEVPIAPGPTAVVTGSRDAAETAKVLKAVAAETKKMEAKAGVLDGAVLTANDVMELAKLPGPKELQAILVGTLAAPMTQLARVMNQKVCSLLYVLNAVREKKGQAA